MVLFRLLSVLLCVSATVSAQMISGTVTDAQKQPLAGVSITLSNAENKIILFKFTDARGRFQFEKNEKLKEAVKIQAGLFGYVKQSREILPDSSRHDFTLEVQVNELNEIKINAPVSQKGDTTSYLVEAFQGKEDRSIGDVISRLPGMTVNEDGTIKYRDKDIEGLYIHGDDLMQSRYGIATKAISKDMIKSIQVIERFQPVRVLKNKVISDKIAVNLVLKNENALKLSGEAAAGAGFPGLLSLHTHAMLFNKTIKTLNTLSFNNTGDSYLSNYAKDLLQDAVADNPGVPQKYINRNRSARGSLNLLHNFKDTLQVKLNLQLDADRRVLDYSSYNRNYLADDTISYHEEQQVIRKPRALVASLVLEQNKWSRFIKNTLDIASAYYGSLSTLNFNGDAFRQALTARNHRFSNSLMWVPAVRGRNTWNISWKGTYYLRPQNLDIHSGIDSVRLNEGIGYQAVFQSAEKKSLNSEIELNYYINDKKRLKKSLQAGVESEFRSLLSVMNLEQYDGSLDPYKGDVGNRLKWQRHRQYLAAAFMLENRKLQANLLLPLTFQQVYFRQNEYSLHTGHPIFFINPYFTLRYFFNPENYIHTSYIFNNNFGDINDVYRGVVLTSFKELSANSSDYLRQVRQHRLDISYTFNNALALHGFSISTTHSFDHQNAVYSTEYEDNILRKILLPYQNRSTTSSYRFYAHKYVFALKSKIELNSSFSRTQYNQFVNNTFMPYINDNLAAGITAGCNLINQVSLHYSGRASWFTGKTKTETMAVSANRLNLYNHSYSVAYTPRIPLVVTLQARQQVNTASATRYFFTDLNARYKFKKRRTELEADISNVFDVRSFGYYTLLANQYFASEYMLRGRMLLVKALFLF